MTNCSISPISPAPIDGAFSPAAASSIFYDQNHKASRMNRGHQILLLAALVWFASGCINMHPTRSGFLADYSTLETIDKRGRVRAKSVDSGALDQVDSFYIEPVIWLADDMGQPASSPRNEEAIRCALQGALDKELSCIRPIVDEIGPGTAIVRSAVTGVQESKPLENLLLMSQILGPFFNGGAVAEIEVLGPNGGQIAAESAAYKGRDWEVIGYFWKPKHAESAMRRAAKQLARDLSAGSSAQPPAGGVGGADRQSGSVKIMD